MLRQTKLCEFYCNTRQNQMKVNLSSMTVMQHFLKMVIYPRLLFKLSFVIFAVTSFDTLAIAQLLMYSI